MSKYVEIAETVLEDDGFLQRIDRKVVVKLKVCPICGSSARVEHLNTDKGEDFIYVECEKCGVHTEAYATYEEAASKWNARKVGIMSKNLKTCSCPFCGGKSEAVYALPPEDSDIDPTESSLVVCLKCGNRTRVYATPDEARKHWIRRV